MKIEVMDITPGLATEWLRQNTRNRPVSTDRAEKYARDMSAGRWISNGETFKRATDGTLLDGQHRLTAIVLSGATLEEAVVISDLAPETQDTMDQGRARTVADVLGINAVKNASIVASIARRGWQWEQANFKFTSHTAPTPAEIRQFVTANPLVHRSAEIAAEMRAAFRVAKPSVVGTTHFILMGVDQDDAAQFFASFAHGAGLEDNHPVLSLRNRFLNDKIMGKRNPFHQDIGLIFRAWNGVREGRTMARILHTAEEPMIQPV